MRIFDSTLAIRNMHEIARTIDDHLDRVLLSELELESLQLEEFGIRLSADDFDFDRCRHWTKKDADLYRREVVILAGLWRSIYVRLKNKKRLAQLVSDASLARDLKSREEVRSAREHADAQTDRVLDRDTQ